MTAADVETVVAPPPVTLHGDDVFMAQNAVRRTLAQIAQKYRREVRHGNDHYAEGRLTQFDRYLDLYERLGGDPTEIRDPENGGASDA